MTLQQIQQEKAYRNLKARRTPIFMLSGTGDSSQVLQIQSPRDLFQPNTFSVKLTSDHVQYWGKQHPEKFEEMKEIFEKANEKANNIFQRVEDEIYAIAVDLMNKMEKERSDDKGYVTRQTSKKFGI